MEMTEWELINKIKTRFPNESCPDFFIYKKNMSGRVLKQFGVIVNE